MPLSCYQPGRDGEEPVRAPAVDDGADEEGDRAVRCGACGHDVTSQRAALAVGGEIDHTFFNPAGVIFEIRCFERAPGCAVAGAPTTEFSWFPGYAWRYAACSACGSHLGWSFQGVEPAFFGLIERQLRFP